MKNFNWLFHGDCLDELIDLKSNSVHSLVCDPPAGISFMGKDWDHHKGGRKEWIAWMRDVMRECLRVMKPGAHGLVWALPRTSHWTATALEDAGFEVRDVVLHLFGQGFPKSLDVSKAIDKAAGAERKVVGKNPNHRQAEDVCTMLGNPHTGDGSITAPSTDAAKQWQGWGTALKPASEHWILVRKPCAEKTVAANVLKWGTGALNIDASRIEGEPTHGSGKSQSKNPMTTFGDMGEQRIGVPNIINIQGRFPANLILDEEAGALLDAQSGIAKPQSRRSMTVQPNDSIGTFKTQIRKTDVPEDNGGGASRFFYCAKISAGERGEGNKHPTVKPQKLMRYLIRMITPPGGIVLDPFMGSGSTGLAAVSEDFSFIGIEKEDEYYKISMKRIRTCSK